MIDKFRGVSANSSPEKCAEHISEERSTEQPSGSISNGRADLRIDTGKRRSNEIDPRHSTAQHSRAAAAGALGMGIGENIVSVRFVSNRVLNFLHLC